MALETAKSTSTTMSQAIKNRFYDELFLTVAEANLVHKQVGQKDRKIPQGSGGYGAGVVYWTRFLNLTKVTSGQGEGVPTTAVSLSAVSVTGSTAQYDNAVSISDILAYTSFGDIMKAAMERLAYNAGVSIDNVIRDTVAISGTFQAPGGIAAAAWTSIPATAVFTIAELRKNKRTLGRNSAQRPEGGNYIVVIHDDVLYDLQADTTTGGWIDANKYTNDNAMKLMSGEEGKLLGHRFLVSPEAKVRGTGVTTSGSVYVTLAFAKDAIGVTELQGLRTYVKGFSSGGTGDPTEKIATAGWKTTMGAAMLDSTFYTNIHTAVSSTA